MKAIPRISEAEWEVLGVLWEKSPLTASQVFDALDERGWKLNTVRTFLTRLESKGVIAAAEGGGGKQFTPQFDRETCVSAASQSFLDRVFSGAAGSLLIHFAKSKRLSAAELAKLQAILDQKRKGK